MIVSVKINVAAVRRQIGLLTGVIRNKKGLLRLIAERLFELARKAFPEQKSPEGKPWAPLSEPYATRKAKRFPGRNILEARGQLKNRALFSGQDGRVAFVEATVPYAAIHQHGGVAGRPGPFKKDERKHKRGISGPFGRRAIIPARPYLPGQEMAGRAGVEITEEALRDAIAKSR